MTPFLKWWQHLPYHIDPVLVDLGGFQIRYYGLMYLVAFAFAYGLMRYRIQSEGLPFKVEKIEDYMTWGIIGVLLGGRLGYVLFYNLPYFIQNPLEVFLPFSFNGGSSQFVGLSGMSYHGGLIGVIVATMLFCRKHKIVFWKFGDLICSVAPLGYTFGRIGNFINSELYGRVTQMSIGMYFPTAPTYQLRHPSQLYEALFEGLILFCILWFLRKKKIFDGFLVSLYIIGYGVFRFFIEYVREPDAHLGFVLGSLSMGQVLCLVMILFGIGLGLILCLMQNRKAVK